jgi:S1-C subfamily serine protease
MNWNQIVEKVTPHVVKIETPEGHGTGFLCFYNQTRHFVFIATANHVVENADRWQQPIRIHHQPSSDVVLVSESQRVIYTDPARDSAVILLEATKLNLPQEPIKLRPTQHRLPIGVEVGWLGYPAIGPFTLCFFSGNISAWQDFRQAYLIDGVAINGVSGGPVIYSTSTEGVEIVGAISAYIPNRATGSSLPGLSVAQDVSHFHDVLLHIQSIDDAARQKQKSLEQGSIEEQA